MILNNHACLQKYFLTAIDLRISGALSCDLNICSIMNAMIVAITNGKNTKFAKDIIAIRNIIMLERVTDYLEVIEIN